MQFTESVTVYMVSRLPILFYLNTMCVWQIRCMYLKYHLK